MRSGYVKRDGTWPGVPSLAASGRNTRPLWAQRLFAAPGGAAVGPAVSATYPVGHYMEDYDYLGDHGYIQGVDFDLDEFNGRWCVTPEFPGGTYAYFVAIDPAGIPAFPYNIGRGYFGTPTGGEETALPGTGLTTNFVGEIHVPLVMAPPAIDAGNVTLTWSAAEGGHYRVERSTDFSSWTTLTTTAPALQTTGSYTTATSSSAEFYRVRRWTFDPFDPVLDIVAPGGTASRGTAIIVRITLPGPVATAQPISWVRLGGSIMAFSFTHPNPTTVIARFIVPPETATGAKDIEIAWELLPLQTLAAAITIN